MIAVQALESRTEPAHPDSSRGVVDVCGKASAFPLVNEVSFWFMTKPDNKQF